MTSSQATMSVEQVQVGDVVEFIRGDVPFEVIRVAAVRDSVRQLDVLAPRGAVVRLTVPLAQPVAVLHRAAVVGLRLAVG